MKYSTAIKYYFISICLFVPFVLLAQGIEITSGGKIEVTGAAIIEIVDGNFTNDGTYTKGTETVTISGSTPKSLLGSSGLNIHNLTINSSSTIAAASNLTVGTLTVNPNAKFTLNTGKTLGTTNFNILSASGIQTGTFVNNGTASTGTANVNQHLSVPRAWYMMSPVSNTVTPTPNVNSLTLYRYLESANDDQTTGISWLSTSTMSPDQGYSLSSPSGTTNITFTGTLNDGSKSFTLTNSDYVGKSKNGFNLIGNPYPSYLEWQEVYAANSSVLTTATMWYRTKVSSTYYFWTVNGVGGLGTPAQATDKIPPMQAFWVHSKIGGGALNLTNEMRVHNTATSNLMKTPASKTAVNQILRLQVSSGEISDETVVYFNSNAADGFDAYDSPKMINGSGSAVPDIYTIVDNKILAINGLTAVNYETEIPLYFSANASTATSFKITLNELSNFDLGTQVWIKNKLSGVTKLVSYETPYIFEVTDTGINPKFSIIIKAPGVNTQIPKSKNLNIIVFENANNQIAISCNDAVSNDANVSVYNSLGQLIASKALKENVTQIEKPIIPGVYLLIVINARIKTTAKMIVR